MRKKHTLVRLAFTSLCVAAAAVALPATALARPGHRVHEHETDNGPTAPSTQITTSIVLNVTHPRALQQFVRSTVTPGNPNFHRFLSVRQFRERFAPSTRQIRQLEAYLRSFGIRVNKVYADNLNLSVTGTAAALNAAFATELHDYTRGTERFHRPAWNVVLPNRIAPLVLSVPGLNNAPGSFRPMIVRLGRGAYAKVSPPAAKWPSNGTATGIPGDYTVGDVAKFYNINPLYHQGVTGSGETIAIMTLANFRQQDAYSYWHDIGLKVPNGRIRKIMVDGGTPIAAGVGDDETSLDVEQSGGVAPDAKIRVYIAPNTNQGFLDLFYSTVSANVASTVSISWGMPEELYFAALNNGVNETGQLQAIHQALLEGAAQGQSFFAAAGDSGAYDINSLALLPQYSKQLSVDSPASDPAITAAGGTTLNATIPGIPSLGCRAITIPTQQVWGWGYLLKDWGNCLSLTYDQLFAVGGGGGVSSYWPEPYYQRLTRGIRRTEPNQNLYYYPNYPSRTGAVDLINLPANFAGRNLPDVSLNADPFTGYVLVDCTDFPATSNPGCAATGFGGTSFVGPQLNGMTALFDQATGERQGLLNPTLYALHNRYANQSNSPFDDITAGNNWFYRGVPGYDDGSGIGAINAARLASDLMRMGDSASADNSHHGAEHFTPRDHAHGH